MDPLLVQRKTLRISVELECLLVVVGQHRYVLALRYVLQIELLISLARATPHIRAIRTLYYDDFDGRRMRSQVVCVLNTALLMVHDFWRVQRTFSSRECRELEILNELTLE